MEASRLQLEQLLMREVEEAYQPVALPGQEQALYQHIERVHGRLARANTRTLRMLSSGKKYPTFTLRGPQFNLVQWDLNPEARQEEKTVTIEANDAYGEHREDLIRTFPKDAERDKELQVGMIVFVTIDEKQVPAQVLEVSENISLDFNHPLAGKDLTFTLKVLTIES